MKNFLLGMTLVLALVSSLNARAKDCVECTRDAQELTAATALSVALTGLTDSSKELVGTWITSCVEAKVPALNATKYFRATYVFQDDGTLNILNQVFTDAGCTAPESNGTESLHGKAIYGNSVSTPADAKAIDMMVDGREGVVSTIYKLDGDKLCFGSQSSPQVDGHPSVINCTSPFHRL